MKIKLLLRHCLFMMFLGLLFASSTYAKFGNTVTIDDALVIPYGAGSKIVYDVHKNTYSVFYANKEVITNAYSVVKNGGKTISSKDYGEIKHSQAVLNDGFGKGKKYTITLSKKGFPTLEQVFYVYPAHEFFFTEISITGINLKSNYMAPLVSETVNIYKNGDERTLFVPFDNDTFIRYDAKSLTTAAENVSSEVGVIYENDSRTGLVLGSVEHMVWKTGVSTKANTEQLTALRIWGGYTDEKVTRDKLGHGHLTGKLIKSPKVFVGYFEDWRVGMEAYGKSNRISESPYVFNWTDPAPFGWNSWGVIQEKLTYEKAIKVVDFFAEELPKFRNGHTAYIDLDSFWDNFTGGMSGDYSKLKEFADYCKKKGMEPGVYWAPFTDWGWKSKGERKAEGSDYMFSEMWTKVNGSYHDFDGARALDPTHPGTLRRVDYIIDKLKSCGFKMIKIDFLGHAAAESDAFHDKSVTTGMQAYRAGMEYLIDRLDGQMLVYAAISPSLATGRYAHVRRIACDAWKTIKDTEYTLNSVNYGWWQTYVYNYVDADHVVFGTETAGSNRARLTSALITGTLILGDDFSADGPWKAAAKKWLQNPELLKLSASGKAFMPVEGDTNDKAGSMFMRKIGEAYYLAVINYGADDKLFTIPLTKLGLKGTVSKAKELFSNLSLSAGERQLSVPLQAGDAAIIQFSLNQH